MRDQDILFRALTHQYTADQINYFIQGTKIDSAPDTLTSARLNAYNNAVQTAICKLTQIKTYLDSLAPTYGPWTYPQDPRVESGMEKPCPIDSTHINHLASPLITDLV